MSDSDIENLDRKMAFEEQAESEAEEYFEDKYSEGGKTVEDSDLDYLANFISNYIQSLENELLEMDGYSRCHCCNRVTYKDSLRHPTTTVGLREFQADFLVCDECI